MDAFTRSDTLKAGVIVTPPKGGGGHAHVVLLAPVVSYQIMPPAFMLAVAPEAGLIKSLSFALLVLVLGISSAAVWGLCIPKSPSRSGLLICGGILLAFASLAVAYLWGLDSLRSMLLDPKLPELGLREGLALNQRIQSYLIIIAMVSGGLGANLMVAGVSLGRSERKPSHRTFFHEIGSPASEHLAELESEGSAFRTGDVVALDFEDGTQFEGRIESSRHEVGLDTKHPHGKYFHTHIVVQRIGGP